MALLKTPLYLCTRFLAGAPPTSCCVRAHQLAGGPAAGRAEPLGGSSSLLPSLRPGKPRRRKAARRRRPGNNGERPEEREPRLRFLRPRRPAPLPPLPAASRTPLCRGARAAAGGLPPRSLPGRHSPSALPTAACPEPAPLTADPRSPLKCPRQVCQFSAALPRAPADLLSQPRIPKPSRPRREACWRTSGAARLARRQPRSRAYPGVGGAGRPAYGSPHPSAGCPRPPATGPAPARPLACREHYQQERRQHYRRAPTRALQCLLLPFRGRCCTQKTAQHCSPL